MSTEPLVRIPDSTVYQVEHVNHVVTSVANGEFLIDYDSFREDGGLQAQVGPVRWALGSLSATLRFNDHTYAFQLPPQQAAAVPYYFCVMLSPDTPLELLDLLQAILASVTAYHDQAQVVVMQEPDRGAAPPPAVPAPSTSDKVAAGLQRGGQLAAAGVLAAAGWAGKAIHRGAEAAVARMTPADRPSSISPETQARLEKAREVAAKAAELSGRAVGGALTVTAQVASSLAARLAATDLGQRLGRRKEAKGLRRVGEAGVDALEAVYDSLAAAARVVLAHSSTAATKVVGHKFGPEAGQVAGTGMQVATSVMETGLNVYKLRPTALAKGVIKGTAQHVAFRPNNGNDINGYSGNNCNGAAAATMSLGALTNDVGQQQQQVARDGNGGGEGYSVLEGVVVTGPALAQPVAAVDYTPSAAVLYGSSTAGGANTGALGAASTTPYTARYYPPIPKA